MSDKEFKMRFPAKFDPAIYAECKRVRMRLMAMYFAFAYISAATVLLFGVLVLYGLGLIRLPEGIIYSIAGGTIVQMGASVAVIYRFLFRGEDDVRKEEGK